MGPGVVAGSPVPKDSLDTKNKEGRGACSLPKGWPVHILVGISVYPEEKRNK